MLVWRAACAPGTARQFRLWTARILPRKDRGIEARRRPRLLPDRCQPRAPPIDRGGSSGSEGNCGRCRLGSERCRARGEYRDAFLRCGRQRSRLRAARSSPHRRNGKHQRSASFVHAAPDAGERFVHVGEAPPETKWASGSNAAFLSARFDPRTGRVVALAALDNLGKGAAGQMIQCANLMLGLDEGAGLTTMGIYP